MNGTEIIKYKVLPIEDNNPELTYDNDLKCYTHNGQAVYYKEGCCIVNQAGEY